MRASGLTLRRNVLGGVLVPALRGMNEAICAGPWCGNTKRWEDSPCEQHRDACTVGTPVWLLRTPAVRDAIVRVLGEGAVCGECSGCGLEDAYCRPIPCRTCSDGNKKGTGYTRLPYDLRWAQDHPMNELSAEESMALLWCAVLLVEAGVAPVSGVRGHPGPGPYRVSAVVAPTAGRPPDPPSCLTCGRRTGVTSRPCRCPVAPSEFLKRGLALRTDTGLVLPFQDGPVEVLCAA